MDKRRRKTNINMLRALLENPGDSGTDLILKVNSESMSIDSESVETLYLEVPALTPDSLVKAAKFFQRVIAPLKVAQENAQLSATPQEYLTFLASVLQTVTYSPDFRGVYPLLRDNLDKLDQNFAQLLRQWAGSVLPGATSLETRRLGALIGNLSNGIGRFPLGNKANNLEIEIAGYETVAKVFTRSYFPQDWAMLQNNLGNAYSERLKGDPAQNLEMAIACFENALQVRTPQQYPEQWATLQNNLGNAYTDRLKGDPADNQEKAIDCYQNALRVRTRESFVGEWASTQNNLGRAYSRRFRGDRAQNLELAIACYYNALQVYNRNVFPRRWATTQNNLANAYCARLRGNRSQNLEDAINCYQRALQIRTKEGFPVQWATTQSNLGRVWLDRVQGDRTENLEMAIACYHNALQVHTRQKFPDRWGTLQTYLGKAYNLRLKGEKSDNLELVITSYQNALLFCSRQKFPERWAMLCAYLGRALSEHLKGERSRNLKTAIACYQNALKVYTRKNYPDRWAMLQNDLGQAFCELTETENSSHLQTAIVCYHNAAQVYTRETYPHRWVQTLFYLGQVHRIQGELLRAYSVFAAAVDTVEFLRCEATIDLVDLSDRAIGHKPKLTRTWTGLYKSLVQVCLELGVTQPDYYAKALEYTERHKALNLVELLVKCHLTPKGDIPTVVREELECLRLSIVAEQQHQEQGSSETGGALSAGDDTQGLNNGSQQGNSDWTHLNLLWKQLDELIASEVEPKDPFFSLARKVRPIGFKQIRELLPDGNCAAVVWASFEEVLVAFVVLADAEYPVLHLCSQQNALELENWISEYQSAYSDQKGRWTNHLQTRLNRLATLLEIDQVVSLVPENCDRLIFVPHGFLHSLPLHALPLGLGDAFEDGGETSRFPGCDRTSSDFSHVISSDFSQGSAVSNQQPVSAYLIDRFARGIRYAPSCQLLRLRQIADSAAIGRYRPRLQQLVAVSNFTKDSLYSNIEVTNICQYFSSAEVLRNKQVNKQDVCSAIANNHGNQSTKTGPLISKKIAHFACLTLVNLASSLKSGVYLKDEFLTLEELFDLDFRQHFLVTLSACEIEKGRVTNDGNFVGFSAGLLYAGTSSVVRSLWKVNDFSTLLMMSKFYENLAKFPRLQTGDVAHALNDAQRWLRDMTGEELDLLLADFLPQILQMFDRLPQSSRLIAEASFRQIRNRKPHPFANPYYWAAFTASGV
jgi:CHAT domain-containing protein/tetratricopeptide (TPR) repeat protein